MHDEISIVPSYEIDRKKWDACIEQSSNGLIYASSVYLDHMADNWSGIVLNDYEGVMPVVWRRKLGIRYCCEVPFIQQLGIISTSASTNSKQFVKALRAFCRYGTYPFNFANNIAHTSCHTNFIIRLDKAYSDISKDFTAHALQNIRRSENNGLKYGAADIDEAIDSYGELYGKRAAVQGKHLRMLKQLCAVLQTENRLVVRKVTDAGGRILATILLPRDTRRMYNIINSTNATGKPLDANYHLLSRLWMEFSGSGLLFDFEGSDLPGVRDFYKKFGTVNQPYFKLSINQLPRLLKILRK